MLIHKTSTMTIDEVIKECRRVGRINKESKLLLGLPVQHTVEVILVTEDVSNGQNMHCYSSEHFKKNCPLWRKKKYCSNCKKNGHTNDECLRLTRQLRVRTQITTLTSGPNTMNIKIKDAFTELNKLLEISEHLNKQIQQLNNQRQKALNVRN